MLTHWGIFVPGRSQGWYHTHFDRLLRRQHDLPHTDDPGVVWERTTKYGAPILVRRQAALEIQNSR